MQDELRFTNMCHIFFVNLIVAYPGARIYIYIYIYTHITKDKNKELINILLRREKKTTLTSKYNNRIEDVFIYYLIYIYM